MSNINITGFKNIHFAPIKTQDVGDVKPTYKTPVAIRGAKNVEISLNFENTTFYCDDTIGYQDNFFTGGEITLSLAGLTAEEYALLFGNTVAQGGLTVNANDLAVEGALLFEKKILGTNAVRRFVIYSAKMSPASVSAETIADSIAESPIEITGVCRMLSTGEIYAMVDTNARDYDPALDNWYEEVKFLSESPAKIAVAKK